MKKWIDKCNALAVFSDPAGAKAVLSFLTLHNELPKSIKVISDREFSFYEDFNIEVFQFSNKTVEDWLEDIDVLITGTSMPVNIETMLIESANKKGIFSVSFVDHWTNMHSRFNVNGALILPKIISVIDEHAYNIAIEEGLPEERLKITGNPYYKYLKAWTPKIPKEELLLSLGIDEPFILYAPEPFSRFSLKRKYGFDETDGLILINQAKNLLTDLKFSIVIKGHPNQEHEILEGLINSDAVNNTIYLRDGDISLLSYYACAVIGFFSNALIEASLVGCTIIRPLQLLRNDINDPLASKLNHQFLDVHSVVDLADVMRIQIKQNC